MAECISKGSDGGTLQRPEGCHLRMTYKISTMMIYPNMPRARIHADLLSPSIIYFYLVRIQEQAKYMRWGMADPHMATCRR